MKIQVFSVYDSKSKVFSQPLFILTVAMAQRIWPDAAADKTSNIGKYPADHTLFHIGEWDDTEGTLTTNMHKENLGTALEALNSNMQEQR